jgi:tartrate dehydrogenase/decarboxylase/D-malate dehydrogenase
MMLQHLGHQKAHDRILAAIEKVTEHGPRTPDMGGKASTAEVGSAIVGALQ